MELTGFSFINSGRRRSNIFSSKTEAVPDFHNTIIYLLFFRDISLFGYYLFSYFLGRAYFCISGGMFASFTYVQSLTCLFLEFLKDQNRTIIHKVGYSLMQFIYMVFNVLLRLVRIMKCITFKCSISINKVFCEFKLQFLCYLMKY